MIKVLNLHKSFGKIKVLDGIDFQLNPGKITVLLGPNGSGKTTLVKSILGLAIPDKGDILVDGQSVKGNWEYRNKISYLPQIARFPDNLTVRELLNMIKDIRQGADGEKDLITLFGLEPYLGKKLKNLSGGTRQKVNVVLFFLFDSPLMIMDEPTAGLDPTALIRLKDKMVEKKKEGKTILLTTHIIPLVEEIADEILFILEGKLYFQGKWDELIKMKGTKDLERSIAMVLEEEMA